MTRRLRVAVWHNLPSGGGKRALFGHVQGLVDKGHHVEAWCPSTADATYLPLSALVAEHVLPVELVPMPQLRQMTDGGRRSPIARNIAALDAHCRDVAEAISGDFDVVLSATCQTLAVPSLGRHAVVPSVLYLQEPSRVLYEAFFRRGNEPADIASLPWARSGAVAAAARRMARAARDSVGEFDRVLVNSRYSRESVLRAYGVSGHVCYLGVDTELFRPPPNPTRDYVVGVGAVVAEKNIEFLLRALGAVADGRPPLVWVANHAYSQEYVASLDRLAMELGVRLSIRTFVSDQELVAIVGGARALIYAPRLEPFGLAPLEANACGVPVVAVAEAGVRETVVDGVNGLLVAPDVASVAAGIATLWGSPDHAAAMGAAGRERVLASWRQENATDRLLRQLHDTLGLTLPA